MSAKTDFSKLQQKIGYVFKDESLLLQAFTHSSYVAARGGQDNERMEFLGDAVVDFVVSETLYQSAEKLDERQMTTERSRLVCGENMLAESLRLGLDEYLRYSGQKEHVGKKTVSSLFESLVAAIYLDGGIEPARKFVLSNLNERGGGNYKSELQELLQAMGKPTPTYREVSRKGPSNECVFEVEVQAGGVVERGTGRSKKDAEQQAVKKALQTLRAGN
jgi:ribonuclease-3